MKLVYSYYSLKSLNVNRGQLFIDLNILNAEDRDLGLDGAEGPATLSLLAHSRTLLGTLGMLHYGGRNGDFAGGKERQSLHQIVFRSHFSNLIETQHIAHIDIPHPMGDDGVSRGDSKGKIVD